MTRHSVIDLRRERPYFDRDNVIQLRPRRQRAALLVKGVVGFVVFWALIVAASLVEVPR